MELQEKLEKFLGEYYYPEIVKSLKEDMAVSIDFSDIDRYDSLLADELLEQPERVLAVFNSAASSLTGEKINTRIKNLPESRNIRIRNLRAVHLNRLWSIDATIKAASEVKPQIYEAVFECPDCKAKITVQQNTKIVQKPAMCECGRRGDFNLVDKKMIDIRWLKAVEPFEVTSGEQPGEITLLLKEDLTTPRMQKKTDPGSSLTIVGIVKEIPKHIKGKLSTNMDMLLEANHVETSQVEFEELEITQEDERKIKELAVDPNVYDMLRTSIAPGIYGFEDIKDSVILQLFGGQVHVLPDGSRVRGNIHILITGDPSVGKTQLLKLVSSVVPRGRYVSGSGVSGAGLCTTYDTLIQLENGSIVKIGDLVERYAERMEMVEQGIYTTEGDELKIMGLEQNTLKIKPMKITNYWKLKSPKNLIKIATKSGKEVKVTENNPIPVLTIAKSEKGSLAWIEAKNLKSGDFVACPVSPDPNSGIFWDEIIGIEEIGGDNFVYDLTVEGGHSFVANGLIIHNTATVVKNEAIGGWVLEAGALILCNKGLIAIDEFDKMSRDDQIAMHEATSVETVSIAKASIVATLPAQTAVLAGANPKLGRFDPYIPIGEQIQIPETLLSRFDLKFALRDRPDKIMDEQLASHIIASRTRPETVEPPIPVQFLRKYIAYSKQITHVELLEETANMLKNFYIDMRNRYAGSEKAVSITLRQYEALIRLAEASARVRLDNAVRVQDAERAIRLMMASLMQLGYDIETQTFDVDRLEGGVAASKRTKMLRALKILEDLQKETKEVAIDDLKAEAENQGIDDINEIIERLDKEGMIIYPRPGFVRKI